MVGSREVYRFLGLELDVAGYELRRNGGRIRLERHPMDLLILLVEHRQQLVSRHAIVERLWGTDVFVDVESGVHAAMRKLRLALGDSATAPSCIETVPGRGYRFIARVEIAPVAAPARTAGRISLAVLPFETIGESERHYLADGLTEETAASLAQIDPNRLSVKGRTLHYKHSGRSAGVIGRELSVDYLLESSIQDDGQRLRVTAKLIQVRDEAYVWARSYDYQSSSLLGLQQELGKAIAEQIHLQLSPQWPETLARRQTESADAYGLYLRARHFANQRTPATTRLALESYARATSLVPDFALAWSGIAEAYAASCLNGDGPPAVVGPPARNAADQSCRADPNLAEGQFAQGYVQWILDWDWSRAEVLFRRAIDLDPQNARSHCCLGHLYSQLGRDEEAEAELVCARQLEPLDPLIRALSSQVAFQGRDYASALEHARQATILDPEFWIGAMMRGQAEGQMQLIEPALESLAGAIRLAPHNSKPISLRAYLLAKAGRCADARDVLAALTTASRTRYVPPYALALIHAGLGDGDAACEWLQAAYAARDVHLMYLPVDAKWDFMRDDPRLGALVQQCGFRPASVPVT